MDVVFVGVDCGGMLDMVVVIDLYIVMIVDLRDVKYDDLFGFNQMIQ